MALPHSSSIDWSSIDSLSDLHRAMFDELVDDRSDTMLIVTSTSTVVLITDMSAAPESVCLGVGPHWQASLGEAAIVTASWITRDTKSHAMWVGIDPSHVHVLS